MKKFIYEARDQKTNKMVKAIVQAESERSAARLLVEQGFSPLSIKEQPEEGGILKRLTNRITSKDKIVYLRQMALCNFRKKVYR